MAVLVLSAPVAAQAAKNTSACIAPIQQATQSSTKKADAALKVKVTGYVEGQLGGSSSANINNQIVLLSQDQLATNLYVYGLCKQVEAGLISGDEFAQNQRFLLGMSGSATAQPVPMTAASSTTAPPAALLLGSWAVTAVPTPLNTCAPAADDANTRHYFWKVGVDPNGVVTVNASGESTGFPILTGRVDGGVVRLTGTAGMDQSVFLLHWDGTTLVGERILSRSGMQGWSSSTPACTRVYDIGATRQP